MQETLFHEKQSLIENSLFGVDINLKSVQICRLRLWIELLKNAYYIADGNNSNGELQTLPNIDINIKAGNSLVSRFGLDEDLKPVLAKSKFTIPAYKNAVQTYREATSKDQKREMDNLISIIKNDFTSSLTFRHRVAKSYVAQKAAVVKISSQINRMEQWQEKVPKKLQDDLQKATAKQEKLEKEVKDMQNNAIYRTSFEWRFEFPEVLDDDGNFIGFDVVIANPPYIRQEEIKELKPHLKSHYNTYSGATDLFVFFIEKGINLIKANGQFCYIVPNKWMQTGYGEILREMFLQMQLNSLIDFGDLQIFDEATTYPCIINLTKNASDKPFHSYVVKDLKFDNFETYLSTVQTTISKAKMTKQTWVVSNSDNQNLLERLKNDYPTLSTYIHGEAYRGIVTGLTEAFIIDEEQKNELIKSNPKNSSIIKPIMQGRDLKSFTTPPVEKYLLFVPWHFPLHNDANVSGPSDNAEHLFKTEYVEVYNHLYSYKQKLSNRNAVETGVRYEWYALQRWASEYWREFEKPKIMYQKFQIKPCFIYDEKGLYCNDSIWFIPSTDKVLLAILNSKLGWWLVSKFCTAIQNGYQLIWKYFGQIPIAPADTVVKEQITNIVDEILEKKKVNALADTTFLEAQLEPLVYKLYKVTEEEAQLIESLLKKKKVIAVTE